MRLDHQAREERLLRRRPDVLVAEPRPGRVCAFRRDQLLVALPDLPAVELQAGRWVTDTEQIPGAGVALLHLRPAAQVDVPELADELATPRRHRSLAATPNHLLRGEPRWDGGPADEPQVPSSTPPAPGDDQAAVRPVTVAVLDTGIAAHPWFEPHEWYAEAAGVEEVLDADMDYELDAQAGHGTFVAGVVLQVAPRARLRIRRVLDSDGFCDEADLVRALTELRAWSQQTREHADVVNLSLGGYTFDDRPSPHIADAIARFGRRTVFVACAGNRGSDRPFWPAALKPVIAVAALGADGADRAAFSNYGWWVDACAVGERVTSSFVAFDGRQPAVGDVDPDRFERYATWSGTSFAAPRVAGAIAALAGQAGRSAADAADDVLEPTARRSMPDLGVFVDTPSVAAEGAP